MWKSRKKYLFFLKFTNYSIFLSLTILYFQVLFAVIFSIARMIGGPYLSYVTLSADNPIIIKVMYIFGTSKCPLYYKLFILKLFLEYTN